MHTHAHILNWKEGKNETNGKRKRGGEKERKKKSQSFDLRRRECVFNTFTHTGARSVRSINSDGTVHTERETNSNGEKGDRERDRERKE